MSIVNSFNKILTAWRQRTAIKLVKADDGPALDAYLKEHPSDTKARLVDHHGTLLHLAAGLGKPNAAQALIDNGAAIEAIAITGCTPLATAMLSSDADVGRRIEVGRLLLKAGANIEYRGMYSRQTILQEAFDWQRPHEALFLLKEGANPKAACLSGWNFTPLMNCLRNNPDEDDPDRRRRSDELLDLGITWGMDVHALDSVGETALAYAQTASQAIKLIEAGANPAHKGAFRRLARDARPAVDEYLRQVLPERKAAKSAAMIEDEAKACHRPLDVKVLRPITFRKSNGVRRLFSLSFG